MEKQKQKEPEKKERKPNWKEYTATVEDIRNFLSDRIFLRHNVITRRVECRIPSSYETDGTEWTPITDRIVNSLWAELSHEKKVRADDIYRVIESDFVPDFHPFRYYLDHLPRWDGQDHILAMSVTVSVKGGIDERAAYALFQQGFQFWFSREEIIKLQEHNRQFEAPRLEQELVHLYFRKPVGVEGGIFMSTARAMQIVSANISQKLNPVYLGRAFGELGFQRVKHCGQRGYVVMQRNGDEIQRLQRRMVDDGEVDSGQ